VKTTAFSRQAIYQGLNKSQRRAREIAEKKTVEIAANAAETVSGVSLCATVPLR